MYKLSVSMGLQSIYHGQLSKIKNACVLNFLTPSVWILNLLAFGTITKYIINKIPHLLICVKV